eukprot:TRINITY_DN389_c1_g2_i1.p1 TRINITY_DN389_c1_g2~~TRINITY_DN389_c1_g2_i1.p1  ORF type:complete len:735 (+),score=263.17 TRINITY_DN389_c1_g2_i1:91-2295(+)
MGTTASHTSAVLGEGLAHLTGPVNFPSDKADAAYAWSEEVRQNTFDAIAATKTLERKLKAYDNWQGIANASDIVKQIQMVNTKVQSLSGKWQCAALKAFAIHKRISKPHILNEVLEGKTGDAAGIVLALLGTQKVESLVTNVSAFKVASHIVQNEAYPVIKMVKDCASVPDSREDNCETLWSNFLTTMLKACAHLLKALDPVLDASYEIRNVLKKFTCKKPKLATKKEDTWAIARATYAKGYTVPLTAFPAVITSRKRLSTEAGAPPAKKVKLAAAPLPRSLALVTPSDSDVRKKIVEVAQNTVYKEMSGKLTKEVDAMKSDKTKFQSVLNSVQHVTPSPPDANGSNLWDQFETIASTVRDWAINFVVALQNAPIEMNTRRETFDVMQTFYTLLQTTSLKLQNYRIFMSKIKESIKVVNYVLAIPDDLQAELQKLPSDDARMAELQKYSDMNEKALADGLKTLQSLLNDESGLNDLLDLHSQWMDLNTSIQAVQVNVKSDIDAFKKKMRTIGWVSMALTAVVGIAVVIGTLGAAGPEVAAVAGEEIAEQAAIEATEVGTEVAVNTMMDSAVDAAVGAGEVEAEAEAATTIGAKDLFTTIANGVGKVATVASLSTGARDLVNKLMSQQLDAIKEAVAGLDHLRSNGQLIQIMLLYIYKDWAKLNADPTISNQDPMKPVYNAWNNIKIAPLLNALSNSLTTVDEITEKVLNAENHIDGEIKTFNTDVFQPLLKMFG